VFLFWHQAGGKHITTAKSLDSAILLIPDLGKSPAITDDGSGEQILLVESGAIIEYLMQTYGKNSSLITPKTGSQEERDYRYWLHFSE